MTIDRRLMQLGVALIALVIVSGASCENAGRAPANSACDIFQPIWLPEEPQDERLEEDVLKHNEAWSAVCG